MADFMAQNGEILLVTVINSIRTVVIKSTLPEKKTSEETLNMTGTISIPHVRNTLPEEKKREETLSVTVTNGVRQVDIRNTASEEKKKIEHLPVTDIMTNKIQSTPSIRKITETGKKIVEHLPMMTNKVSSVTIPNVTKNSKEKILNLTKLTLNQLNARNLNTLAQKLMAMKIESKAILEEMTEMIHQKALSRPDISGIYAELCAVMCVDNKFKESLQAIDVTMQLVLLPKCFDVFYSYQQPKGRLSAIKTAYDVFRSSKNPSYKQSVTNKSITPQNLSPVQDARLLANSVFIAELYNRGVFPESILWSFVMDLVRKYSNAQIHCLATILNLAGQRLSKTYSLSSIVGHLLILENESEREDVMCADLRKVIHDVKIQHAKCWIHEEPDRAVKETMRCVNANLIRPNKSFSEREEYAISLMTHCAMGDCYDLLSTIPYRNNLNEVKHLLTPALNALIKTDQMSFIVHLVLTAVNEICPRIRADAGKLLAELVKARLLSKLIVFLGLEKANEDYAMIDGIPVLVSEIESEFVRQLHEV